MTKLESVAEVQFWYPETISVVGIDPSVGTQSFSTSLKGGTSTTIYPPNSPPSCPCGCPLVAHHMQPESQNERSVSTPTLPTLSWGSSIIAGDGYAYTLYTYQVVTTLSQSQSVFTGCSGYGYPQGWSSGTTTTDTVTHLMLKRVGTDGRASDIDVQDFDQKTVDQYYSSSSGSGNYNVAVTTGTQPNPGGFPAMITNADQGVALSWTASTVCPAPPYGATNVCTPVTNYGFATTSGATVLSYPVSTAVYPVLQAQDGSFYGTDNNGNMIRMTQSGQTMWSVRNDYPQIATADGGVIGYSGVTYDSQGRATGQITNMPTQSWLGNAYQIDPGQAQQVFSPTIDYANSVAASVGGNLSGTGTYVQPIGQLVREEIASVAVGYVGSKNWLDYTDQNGKRRNQCNLFVHDVLTQSGGVLAAPMQSSAKELLKYFMGWNNSPTYPALAGDWANPGTILDCWQIVPGGADHALPGDVIAEPVDSHYATGHVGIVTGTEQTTSADSAAPCFPPYAPAGIIDISNFGFRPDNWIDPFNCRTTGKRSNAVVRRFVCQ